jgi:chemotaxis protein MotD
VAQPAAKPAAKTAATAEKTATTGEGTDQATTAEGEAAPTLSTGGAGTAAVATEASAKGEHKSEHKAAQHAAAQGETATPNAAAADTSGPRHHADANAAANQLSAAPDQVLSPAPQPLAASTNVNANGMPTTQWTANVATNAAVPMNRLAIEIAATAQSGNSRFEIRLDPAELGRIDVRIEVDRHGNVTSHLTVEKPETLTMLRNDAPQLQRALDDAGLKTGDGGLQFSLRDQSSSGQNNNSDDQQPHYHRLEIGEEEVPPAAVIGRNYGRMLGGAGGVDIRV